jgi:hypothetical protein
MHDDTALAFKTRHFTSHGIGEALRLLHGMFADNQFVRHDRPLLKKYLFFFHATSAGEAPLAPPVFTPRISEVGASAVAASMPGHS